MHHMAIAGCVIVGLLAAFLSALLTACVYGAEDLFSDFPFIGCGGRRSGAWSWGLAGYLPQALGVGYGVIQRLVTDDVTWKLLIGVLLVKSFIWTFSLGSIRRAESLRRC